MSSLIVGVPGTPRIFRAAWTGEHPRTAARRRRERERERADRRTSRS